MNLAFREKVLWINLLATLLLVGWYIVARQIDQPFDGGAIWSYLKVCIWVVVLEVFVIAVLAAKSRPEKPDERDRGIALRGYRWGYFVLAIGLGVALWQTAVGALGDWLAGTVPPDSPMVALADAQGSPIVIIHLILGALILAEVVKSAVQLVLYRRGI